MRGATDVPSTKDINIEALSRRPPAGSKLKGSGTATPALKAIEIKAYSCSIGTRETDPSGSLLSTQRSSALSACQVSREGPPGVGLGVSSPGFETGPENK